MGLPFNRITVDFIFLCPSPGLLFFWGAAVAAKPDQAVSCRRGTAASVSCGPLMDGGSQFTTKVPARQHYKICSTDMTLTYCFTSVEVIGAVFLWLPWLTKAFYRKGALRWDIEIPIPISRKGLLQQRNGLCRNKLHLGGILSVRKESVAFVRGPIRPRNFILPTIFINSNR